MSSKNENYPHISVERQIIHLMLRYINAVDELWSENIRSHLFEDAHQHLVQSIFSEFVSSDKTRLLTREHYVQSLSNSGLQDNTYVAVSLFDKCYFGINAEMDDLGLLKKKLIEGYVSRKCKFSLDKFKDGVTKQGYVQSASKLVDDINLALSLVGNKSSEFVTINDAKDQYCSKILKMLNNPDEVVICGIPEIDDAINTGFKPGHLTLFVGDVASNKSNVMLNIALNLYEKYNHNVLFIPIEMSYMDVLNRIISNRTGIHIDKIVKPSKINAKGEVEKRLTDAEMETIQNTQIWINKTNKFAFLEVSERVSVSFIRHEIENRILFFKPKIVVIDYIALMQPDIRNSARNDLEIGEILKALRMLGRKYGFHVISAAQMGRGALTKMRQDGVNSSQPDSTSIRGSHEYSADADTIFALIPIPNEESQLKIYTIKARYGKARTTKTLGLDAARCKIYSTDGVNLTCSTDGFESEINETPLESVAALQSSKQESKKSNNLFNSINIDDL